METLTTGLNGKKKKDPRKKEPSIAPDNLSKDCPLSPQLECSNHVALYDIFIFLDMDLPLQL